ncbi:MAG TPA: cytochrome b [Burkholderiaceae bacterium]|nr:cytochrome b [Burkholderiaceae bacterium]
MNTKADANAYGAVAIGLHWLLALAILGSLSVGFYMADLPFSPLRLRLFNWHKWAGITILALSAARLLWRLAHAPPALPADVLAAMPGWQRGAHRATHALLYLLFFAVPLSGWAYTSAAGFPIVWFGVLPLPDWVAVDKELADAVLKPLHHLLAFTLAALVALHVAATLKHQFVDRDALFWRMWPRGVPR